MLRQLHSCFVAAHMTNLKVKAATAIAESDVLTAPLSGKGRSRYWTPSMQQTSCRRAITTTAMTHKDAERNYKLASMSADTPLDQR